MKTASTIWIVLLLVAAGPAAGREIRPTLDKLKETGVVHLGYRETSRPFSFVGTDGKPAGYSVDLCQRIATGVQQQLKLPKLDVKWVAVSYTHLTLPTIYSV